MLRNATQNKAVAQTFKLCSTSFQRMRGLMFSSPKTLVFEFDKPRRVAFHMWFVFFPIDAVFLDENKEVVDMKLTFLPFTTYSARGMVKYAIEAPSGKLVGTRIGDCFSWGE